MTKKQRTSKTMLSFRVSPRMRYALELIGRSRGLGTTTEAIEYALQRVLESPRDGVYQEARDEYIPLTEVIDRTWGEDEVARFLRLAERFPELLTREERRLWDVVNSTESVLLRVPDASGDELDAHTEIDEDAVRAQWPELQRAAARA
jgi:hypothetical protein